MAQIFEDVHGGDAVALAAGAQGFDGEGAAIGGLSHAEEGGAAFKTDEVLHADLQLDAGMEQCGVIGMSRFFVEPGHGLVAAVGLEQAADAAGEEFRVRVLVGGADPAEGGVDRAIGEKLIDRTESLRVELAFGGGDGFGLRLLADKHKKGADAGEQGEGEEERAA